MYKLFLGTAIGVLLFSGQAMALCTSYLTLTNGTTADANDVMHNFGCAALTSGATLVNVTQLGVGTASPSVLLDVENPTVSSNVAIIKPASGSASTTKILDVQAGNGTSLGTFYNGGSGVTTLYVNGNVGVGTSTPSYTLHVNGSVAGTSAYNNLSDARLKKNITPLVSGLALVSQLQPVRFDWRNKSERVVGKDFNLPATRQIGFVAQDVAKILPEAVSTAKGKNAIMSVAESKIIPALVAAVKELKAANDNQAAHIDQLEARVALLQHKLGVQTAAK